MENLIFIGFLVAFCGPSSQVRICLYVREFFQLESVYFRSVLTEVELIINEAQFAIQIMFKSFYGFLNELMTFHYYNNVIIHSFLE